jgi:Rieske Fe-S protein
VLAAVTGVLAGITAAVGRALQGSETSTARRAGSSPTPSRTASSLSSPSPGESPAGRELVAVSAVPRGRAVRFTDNDGGPAWLVRESNGDFRAFSAICTHAGCTVGIAGNQFVCPCHSGHYSVQTGAVLSGPPPSPLSPLRVQVAKGKVWLV